MTIIKTEQCANPQHRVFHTRHRFASGSVEISGCDSTDDLSRRQVALLKSILAIHGVECVYCGDYEVSVGKGAMFTWEELEGPILKRIEKYLEPSKGRD